jgi:hypothetical protein
MLHSEIWSLSYEERNGWELNWQFDFQPLKFKKQGSNHLFMNMWYDIVNVYVKTVTLPLITLIENLYFGIISLKSCEVHNLVKLQNFESFTIFLPLWCSPITNHGIYYKEEIGELFPSLGHGMSYELDC